LIFDYYLSPFLWSVGLGTELGFLASYPGLVRGDKNIWLWYLYGYRPYNVLQNSTQEPTTSVCSIVPSPSFKASQQGKWAEGQGSVKNLPPILCNSENKTFGDEHMREHLVTCTSCHSSFEHSELTAFKAATSCHEYCY